MKKLIVLLAFSIACVDGWAQLNDTVKNTKQPNAAEEFPVYEKEVFHGDLKKFLSDNIQIPLLAQKKGIQGRVIVEFIIEKDGSITNIKTVKGIGRGCDEEAERVMRLTNGMWTPGKNNGKPVRLKMLQPILFTVPKKRK